MSNLPTIGRYHFMAEPFHCDFTKHLFIGHLGNNLLNAADFHSNERGYGVNYLNTIKQDVGFKPPCHRIRRNARHLRKIYGGNMGR